MAGRYVLFEKSLISWDLESNAEASLRFERKNKPKTEQSVNSDRERITDEYGNRKNKEYKKDDVKKLKNRIF